MKQFTIVIAVAIPVLAGICVVVLLGLDAAGIHAPGPPPVGTGSRGSSAVQSANGSTAEEKISATPPAEPPAGEGAAQGSGPVSELQAAFGPTARVGTGSTAGTAAEPADFLTRPPLVQTTVRTTAYTHTEADHIKYGTKTALGTDLRYSPEYHSVAADWSRFPLGTKFRMKGVDRLFVVDDYGIALVGSNTIDIYFRTKRDMNHWGVRWVGIEVIEFGSFHESRKILAARANFPHCLEMLASMTNDDWWKSHRETE